MRNLPYAAETDERRPGSWPLTAALDLLHYIAFHEALVIAAVWNLNRWVRRRLCSSEAELEVGVRSQLTLGGVVVMELCVDRSVDRLHFNGGTN